MGVCVPSGGPPDRAGDGYLAVLPVVERHARVAFRYLDPDAREEAVAEAVAAGFVSFEALRRRGRDPRAFPAGLAAYAVLHVKDGRHVGGASSTRDVLSRKARARRGFAVGPLPDRADDLPAAFLDDRTPVPDRVAFRLDVPAFLRTLPARSRRMAGWLALSYRADEVARRFGVSPARVTQLRKAWLRAWRAFHEGPVAGPGPRPKGGA